MKKLLKKNDGQFVIIAALLVAIMMISLSPLLHQAATYYTHEPWDEYIALIGNIELNFERLMALSLANYTQNQTLSILDYNLDLWRADLPQIYPGRGVYLDYQLAYGSGIYCSWNKTESFSRANAQFSLEISSIGLTGYEFDSEISLNLNILPLPAESNSINVTVTRENNYPVDGLNISNFNLTATNCSLTGVTRQYDPTNLLIYTLTCNNTIPANVAVDVWDQRGIAVFGHYPSIP